MNDSTTPSTKEEDIPIEEQLTEEEREIERLALEARQTHLANKAAGLEEPPKSWHFPKWTVWVMASILLFNGFSFFFQAFNVPAWEFLKTSTALYQDEQMKTYKKSVAVIQTMNGHGTGFVFTHDGKIVTNEHVVGKQSIVTVSLPGEGTFDAPVSATYPEYDLAVIDTQRENLQPLAIKRGALLEGEPIRFIGNPLSFIGIANEGVTGPLIQLTDWTVPVLTIQAPVYKGNSGSPVFTLSGEVIGIIFATTDRQKKKVGLVVPIDYLLIQDDYTIHEKTPPSALTD